jgi:hypothetical protein
MSDELLRLERALAERDHAATPGGLASLLADDVLEFGASGRTWDRASTGAMLEETAPVRPLVIDDWQARALAENVALVTYTLRQPGRTTRRSSVWRATAGGWRLVFHQGTPVPDPAP